MFNRKNRPNLFFPIYTNPGTGEVSLAQEGDYTQEVLPINTKGEDGCWTWSTKKVANNTASLTARQVGTGAWRVFRKDYLPADGATTKAKALWLDKSINHENGKEELGRLFGESPFDFPKSVELIKQCVRLGTTSDEPDVVLDFFAGSATTAQAVMELNREDGGARRFIMVQLPEPSTTEGFETLADIGAERIRRVATRMKSSENGKMALDGAAEDLGFRYFRLVESNYRSWAGVEGEGDDAYGDTMTLFTDPLVDGWEPEAVVWEVALKEGFSLSSSISQLPTVTANKVYRVVDTDREQEFTICLDHEIAPQTLAALGLGKTDLFICRDAALTDESAANLALQCRFKTI